MLKGLVKLDVNINNLEATNEANYEIITTRKAEAKRLEAASGHLIRGPNATGGAGGRQRPAE